MVRIRTRGASVAGGDPAGRLDAVEVGHADVHQRRRRGAASRPASTASTPSAASPTTSMSGSASRITRKPLRTSAWSSAISDADHVGVSERAAVRGRRSRRRVRRRPRACRRRARPARASRSVRGPAVARSARPCAVVDDLELDRVAARSGRRPRRRRPGVLERVGQRLLHDPVGGEVDAGRAAARGSPSIAQLDRQPGRRAPARRAIGSEPSPGCGAIAELLVARRGACPSSRRSSTSAVAAARLDRAERAARPLRRRPRAARAARLRLHDHDADAVRDHVVQLARDARALLGDCPLRLLLALALEQAPRGPRDRRRAGVVAQVAADEPRDRERQPCPRVGRRWR